MIPELEKYKIEEINDIYVLMSIISLNRFEMPRMYYSRNKGILELRGESISAVKNTAKFNTKSGNVKGNILHKNKKIFKIY